jgi:hypothetical protein
MRPAGIVQIVADRATARSAGPHQPAAPTILREPAEAHLSIQNAVPEFWNIRQLMTWICFRDSLVVDEIEASSATSISPSFWVSLIEAHAPMMPLLGYDPDLVGPTRPIPWSGWPNAPRPRVVTICSVADAEGKMLGALKDGRLKAVGVYVKRGEEVGERIDVPRVKCQRLTLKYGNLSASDPISGEQFLDLTFSRHEAAAIWTAPGASLPDGSLGSPPNIPEAKAGTPERRPKLDEKIAWARSVYGDDLASTPNREALLIAGRERFGRSDFNQADAAEIRKLVPSHMRDGGAGMHKYRI